LSRSPGGLVDHPEVIEQADRFRFRDAGRLEALAIPLDGELGHPLFQETESEHAAALDGPAGVLAGELELPDRLVDQPHLLVRDAEVRVGLVVLGGELLLDAFLELAEDLFERDLPFRPVIAGAAGIEACSARSFSSSSARLKNCCSSAKRLCSSTAGGGAGAGGGGPAALRISSLRCEFSPS
jgi:hypothetical protein